MFIRKIFQVSMIFLSSLVLSGTASASCSAYFCSIVEFPGTPDEQIEAAILASQNTTHKLVYIPNGTYEITRTIGFPGPSIDVEIRGESDTGVILKYIPTPIHYPNVSILPHMIEFDRLGGYTDFNVTLQKLTLDMSEIRNHPYYAFPEDGKSSHAHAIRVGNGWDTGGLKLYFIRINYAGGYGIGIQTNGSDKNADNILMNQVHIENSGLDAIDTKHPDSRMNKNLGIFNLYVKEVGLNSGGNASGIDMRYDEFYVRGYTFDSQANRFSTRGHIVPSLGIWLRGTTDPLFSTRDGILRNLDIKNGNHGVRMDRNNQDVTLKLSRIYDLAETGVYVRDGKNITMGTTCVWNTGSTEVVLTGNNVNVNNYIAPALIPQCPKDHEVGSHYRKDF